MKQWRISWAGISLADLVMGVAAVPQPNAMHPPQRTGAMQPSNLAIPPSQALPAAQSHTPASPPLHLQDYLPIGSGNPTTLDAHSLLLLGGKFVVVLLLLLISLRILKAIMPNGRGGTGRQAGMVLHTERVGEKGRVMLLDLQSRLVLVGSVAGAMTPLTTIDDPDEVAAMRSQYRGQPGTVAARKKGRQSDPSFATMLAQEATMETLAAPVRHSPTLVMQSAVSEGASRTRKLRPAPQPATPTAAQPASDDPLSHAISAMRALRQRVEQA